MNTTRTISENTIRNLLAKKRGAAGGKSSVSIHLEKGDTAWNPGNPKPIQPSILGTTFTWTGTPGGSVTLSW